MVRNNSFLTLCVALISLLALRLAVVEAFTSRKALYTRTSARRMDESNDSGNHHILPARQRRNHLEREKKEWISRSVDYYSKVMREERRRNERQGSFSEEPEYQEQFAILAKKHYFALRKIKTGKLNHAESIYRRIIDELQHEEDGQCDHAKLAVTTLLLALLKQRMGDRKGTRSVFLNFFRIAVLDNDETECACSAKVLCAYALFEMRQGNARKAVELVNTAIKFDRTLTPVLQWKQFRDVLQRQSRQATESS